MNINFITFANTDSNFSQERIIFEAKRMDIFNNITFYTEKDFDEEFMNRCGKEFQQFRRGYGYWSWKPYIIKKELEKVNDGDVVVYADSGCMFKRKNRKILKEWINIVKNSESGVLSPCYGPYIEHDWTRGDLYDYINKTYNKNNVDIFDKAVQCGCGISLYMKNAKCVDFVNQWYDVMTNHFHLCTDEPSSVPNHPNFRENRHDQSVFSMLSKIYNIETIETAKGILDKENSPIIATRCKTDKNSWKKPIDVLFDSQIYDLQNFGGISRMYSDMANDLNRNEIIQRYTGNGITSGKYQDYYARFSIGKTDNAYLKDVYCDDETPSNHEISVSELKKGDFDIFYPTFFSPYFLNYIGDKPYIMSVHDMIPEIYDEYFSRNDLQIVGKKEMVKHAAAIEVPSECTKKDLIKILGVDESKIHVIGRALNPKFGTEYYDINVLGYDYILYVGQRNAYKRFDWFIKHIAPFLEKHKDINVVCTGKQFNNQEIRMIAEHNLWGRVRTIFADDVTMASLYKHAKFFVFSSEYEGFGLPVLESYKMGCIALLNDIEVFREITDGQGTFFNLKENESNLSEVAEKVVSLTNEEKNAILEKQYKILQKYSFEKYMNNVREIFNSVLSKKKNENLDLFICTHKDFEKQVSNPCYKVINAKDINGDVAENGLKGSFYSEILLYFNVAKKYPLKDYVGFCHYRKYFSFMDNVPDMDDFFKNYDALVVKPLKFNSSIKEHYATYHNVEDLEIVENIIANKFPEYYNAANFFFNKCTEMFPCNMFIMKKNDFIKYTEFIKGVLDEYVNIVGTDIEKRIEDNKDKYLKDLKGYPQNKEPWYQYRIGGYLAERLTNVFILQHFKRVGICEMIETEKKY